MTRDKERRLVDLLKERTESRRLDWNLSVGSDSYVVSFADSSIVIMPHDTGRRNSILIEITNNEGEVVDRFDGEELERGRTQDNGIWVRKLQDIHDRARRTVLKADVILESILERLEH